MITCDLIMMVRDNAIHGWRTPQEIAIDEKVDLEMLIEACEGTLSSVDMGDVRRALRAVA